MKRLCVVLVVLCLSGCASFQAAVNGYEAAGIAAAQAADDNLIKLWSVQGCAFPLSAVLRNPQVIPALKVLCMPQTAAVGLLP